MSKYIESIPNVVKIQALSCEISAPKSHLLINKIQRLKLFPDIMNKKPEKAWQLFKSCPNGPESFDYLNLISNDCYKVSQKFNIVRHSASGGREIVKP